MCVQCAVCVWYKTFRIHTHRTRTKHAQVQRFLFNAYTAFNVLHIYLFAVFFSRLLPLSLSLALIVMLFFPTFYLLLHSRNALLLFSVFANGVHFYAFSCSFWVLCSHFAPWLFHFISHTFSSFIFDSFLFTFFLLLMLFLLLRIFLHHWHHELFSYILLLTLELCACVCGSGNQKELNALIYFSSSFVGTTAFLLAIML